MKIATTIIFLLVLTAAILPAQSLKSVSFKAAEELSAEFQKANPNRTFKAVVAVLDFKDLTAKARQLSLGRMAATYVSARLGDSLIFRIVEREELSKVIKEIELGQTGLLDTRGTVEAGKLLEAEYLIDGQIGEDGEDLIVQIRLLKTETGEVVASKDYKIPRAKVFIEADQYLRSTFQSRYGLGIRLGEVMLFTPYTSEMGSPMQSVFSSDVTYKPLKFLEIGVGYFMTIYRPVFIDGGQNPTMQNSDAVWVKVIDPAGGTNYSPRWYNFNMGGPSFSATLILSPLRKLNIGIRVQGIIPVIHGISQKMQMMIYEPGSSSSNVLQQRMVTVNGTKIGDPWMAADFTVSASYLISKRVSLDLDIGYFLMPDYIPDDYESLGVIQQNSVNNVPSRDLNGTFVMYGPFNFNRFQKSDGSAGGQVKMNLSGFSMKIGISVYF